MTWWTNAETFHASTYGNDWGVNGHFDWGPLAQSRFTFTTHCPIDKNFIDRCHQMGVRCFPYISFYFGPKLCTFGPITSNTYEGVDFSQHPEFFEWGPDLQPRPWVFGTGIPDGVGVFFPEPDPPYVPCVTCPNYLPYQEEMVAWVEYIMQQGADGIFVDNIVKRRHCYAPHAHIYTGVDSEPDPDLAQNQAFTLLLSKIRAVVKSYQPNGLVLGNTGDPLGLITGQTWPAFQQYLDSDCIEDYVCEGPRTDLWQNRLKWDDLGQQLQAYLAQGKQILAISGLQGTAQPGTFDTQLREDAFFCYCSARVAGLTWYGGPMNAVEVGDLHRVRLGNPLGSETSDATGQVKYRVFEHGIVAINWDKTNAHTFQPQNPVTTAGAPIPPIPEFLYDLFAGGFTNVDRNATDGLVQVPANSGRVFLFGASTDYGLNRLSAPGTVAAASSLEEVMAGVR